MTALQHLPIRPIALAALALGLLSSFEAISQSPIDGKEWNQFACAGESSASSGKYKVYESNKATMYFSVHKTKDLVLLKGWDTYTQRGKGFSRENRDGRYEIRKSARGVYASFKRQDGGMDYELKFDTSKSTASASYVLPNLGSIFLGKCSPTIWMK